MGKGDHGYVGSGALSGLLGVLDASSGLVVSRDVGRFDDAFDVSPSQGGCLLGRAPFAAQVRFNPAISWRTWRSWAGFGPGSELCRLATDAR